jgi:predicted permease
MLKILKDNVHLYLAHKGKLQSLAFICAIYMCVCVCMFIFEMVLKFLEWMELK